MLSAVFWSARLGWSDCCGEVDLVPYGVSDFTASGGGKSQELERGDCCPVSVGCFDRPNSCADHLWGRLSCVGVVGCWNPTRR